MVVMKTQLFLSAVLVQFFAAGQTLIGQPDCAEIKELVINKAIANRLDEAEAAISAAVLNGKSVCAGVALGNVAVLLSISGRIRDSEAFAARSVALLRKNVDPDDPMLFRSLHALAIARLEQGKFRKAEQAYEQMLQLRASAQSSVGRFTSREVCCDRCRASGKKPNRNICWLMKSGSNRGRRLMPMRQRSSIIWVPCI